MDFTWVILELKLESVSYWSKVSVVVSTRGREAIWIWSSCFWILIFWMLWSWSYYMKQSCYFFIALHHMIISETFKLQSFQSDQWTVKLALFPSIFKNNKTRRNSRTEQFKEIHATFRTDKIGVQYSRWRPCQNFKIFKLCKYIPPTYVPT